MPPLMLIVGLLIQRDDFFLDGRISPFKDFNLAIFLSCVKLNYSKYISKQLHFYYRLIFKQLKLTKLNHGLGATKNVVV